MRPEVEALPWGTLDPRGFSPDLLLAARKSWTLAAFQEHRTGVACAETVQALMVARAPVDLVALAARFPLDELVHVEICARLAEALGGGTHVEHDPRALIPSPSLELPPLLRAAECAVRYFCIGEALSIPLLHGTWRAAKHPLIKACLGRIVRDEAAHGTFGFTYLDWVGEELSDEDRAHLARAAGETIDALVASWHDLQGLPEARVEELHALGWMQTEAYLALAQRSLRQKVLVPLRARGIDPVLQAALPLAG
jgi:hypothetical protein